MTAHLVENSWAHLYTIDGNVDFPTMTNEQYVELFKQKDYDTIIQNSYRLVAKVIARYRIPPNFENLWLDLFQSCLAKVIEVLPAWEPSKGQLSTYLYWPCTKAVQEHLKLQGQVSFGNYQDYCDKGQHIQRINLDIEYAKDNSKGNGKKSVKMAEVLASDLPNPLEIVLQKEHNHKYKSLIVMLKKHLQMRLIICGE